MSSAISNFINEAESNKLFILDVVVRNDGEVTDHWKRFEAAPRFETFSVAKSFTGIGVGLAYDDGLLDLSEKVLPILGFSADHDDNGFASEVTIQDLLTMTSGLANTMLWRDGYERRHELDWQASVFKNGIFRDKPGSRFLYNNANSYLLSCIVEKRCGVKLREYMRNRVFEPVEIGNVEWLSCPMGHTLAANGLSINAEELSRFGQMIANGGVYKGKRIVSEEYISKMLTGYIETKENIPGTDGIHATYGYQVWIDPARDAAFLWGSFGQYCVVLPKQNKVVTVLSMVDCDGGSNGKQQESPLRKMIWNHLVDN